MHGNIVHICFCSRDSKMEIPRSDSFVSPLRRGYLHKLTGRGWLYSGTWKRRYCVLDNSKLYYYEGEHSPGSEKSSGVINLDYFDVCEEGKDKKNPHVFVVGTSVRGLFDNRHQFATETSDELESWIGAIQAAINEARVSRRKHGKKRHLDGKTSSNSSQESEGPSCLVNATKDRARGPQGRRLPQRKSFMPNSRSSEQTDDNRQRSVSLSSPHSDGFHEEEELNGRKNSDDGKWLSLSMEEVDRSEGAGLEEEHRRSSSVFDIPKEEEEPRQKKAGSRGGNLLGQHAALTRELEMRLKAGMAPGARRRASEPEDTNVDEDVPTDPKLERLAHRVDTSTSALAALEMRVGQLSKKVDAHLQEDGRKTGDVLLQVTVALQEAERINAECKRALADANKAKAEYQSLAKEFQDTLAKLSSTKQEEA